jgi:chromosome segregation ATPase
MIKLYKELEGPLGEKAAKALIETLERMRPHEVGEVKEEKPAEDQILPLRSDVARIERRFEQLGERLEVQIEDLQALRNSLGGLRTLIILGFFILLLGLVALGFLDRPDTLNPFEEIR